MAVRKFLVVSDDSPEFDAALKFACRRAVKTDGRVVLLRAVEKSVFEHWSGVREEIERQARAEAEAVLQRVAEHVVRETGHPPEFVIREGDTRAATRAAIAADPDIKVLVLAAAAGGKGPGPLVSMLAREGLGGHRKVPVTVVPGDLTEAEIEDLA